MRHIINDILKVISVFCILANSICFSYADYEYPETDPVDAELSGSNACAVYNISASGSVVYVSVRSANYSNWSFDGYLYDSLSGEISLNFNKYYYSDTCGLSNHGYRQIYLYGTITNTSTNQSCSIDDEGGIVISHYY